MIDDVNYLLSLKEDENVEIKEGRHKIPLSFYESYCAMANGSGGTIYLGMVEGTPNNTICGVENAPQKKMQLCNALTTKSKIANNVFSSSDITIIATEFGDVLRIKVNAVPINQRPVYLDGDPSNSFKRVNDGDKLLSEDEIRSMINDSNTTKFDQKPNDYSFTLDDMDQDAVNDFVAAVAAIGKITSATSMDAKDILSRVGAMVIDKEKKTLIMTNGAALFFGKSYVINSICPSLWLDYQEKTSSDNRFSDRITIKDLNWEPNIYNFYKNVFSRICSLLPSPFYHESGKNVGKKKLEEVVREAFANSISNLELWSSFGLTIVKTASTLFFKNAGGMLVSMEQALKGGLSSPRNPCIFNLFLAMGISDHGGYGIPNIFEKMKMLKMPTPELEESWNRDETSLLLTFTQLSNLLTREEQKIISFLSFNPEGVSSSQIAEQLSCSTETARQLLLHLISLGEVMDNGKKNKGRLYYLMNKDYSSIKEMKLKIEPSETIKNNPNFSAEDLEANDINGILTKTVKDSVLELVVLKDDEEERHQIIRTNTVGYCTMEMGGLHDTDGGFVSSKGGLIELNKFIVKFFDPSIHIMIVKDGVDLIDIKPM